MTDYEKYQQIKKEAKATGILLLGLIIFWLIAGFGLADSKLTIFHLPLWAVMGSVGMWLVAIVGTKLLTSCFFADMDLQPNKVIEETEVQK